MLETYLCAYWDSAWRSWASCRLCRPLAQDTLTFDNGNILSGRIKRFERGEVTLADGDIYADWNRIVLIDSQRVFQFQTSEASVFLGASSQKATRNPGRWSSSTAASPGHTSAMTSW